MGDSPVAAVQLVRAHDVRSPAPHCGFSTPSNAGSLRNRQITARDTAAIVIHLHLDHLNVDEIEELANPSGGKPDVFSWWKPVDNTFDLVSDLHEVIICPGSVPDPATRGGSEP